MAAIEERGSYIEGKIDALATKAILPTSKPNCEATCSTLPSALPGYT